MKFFIKYYDPDPVDGGGAEEPESIHEAIMNSPEFSEDEPQETPDPKDDPKPAEEPKEEPATPDADYKGEERRRKRYEGERRRGSDKADEDPEYDLGFEIEEGKGNYKAKMSEVKQAMQWLIKNKGAVGASVRIRELAQSNPEFGKMFDTIINKSVGQDGKIQSEFVAKTLKSLEEKVDKIEDNIEDKDEEIKKAEQLLDSDEIDPDSVQAQVLRSNIAAMKSQRGRLNDALKRIDEISNKFGEVETKTNDFLKNREQEETSSEVKRISTIFTKEYDRLLTEAKVDFVDDADKNEFESRVRSIVAKGAADIKDDQSFMKLTNDAFKAVSDRTRKLRESAVNDYLKKKGEIPKDEKKEEAGIEEMQKQLKVLEESGKTDSPEAQKLRDKIELEEDPLKGKSMGEALADAMYIE